MRSRAIGESTSELEVLNVSRHGFWLLVGEQEHFLSFETFPWFREASIASILKVESPSPGHLYWPDLDIDLELESIASLEKYPLVYQPTE